MGELWLQGIGRLILSKIWRGYDINVVCYLIGVQGAGSLQYIRCPNQSAEEFLVACQQWEGCLPCSYYHIRLPNHIISPHHQGNGIVILVSSELLPSMNSDWWLQTIWTKTTQQWWFTSMMSTTTLLYLTGPPMRHKSRRRMTEICPKECSRLLLHKSRVSLEAFSRVLSTIFLPTGFLLWFSVCTFNLHVLSCF